MKKLTDEDLQRMLEDGSDTPVSNKEDLEAYRLLFTELSKEPNINLPHNFASRVAAQVQAKSNRGSVMQFYLLLGTGIAAITAVIYSLLLFTNYTIVSSFKVAIGPYKWAIGFIILSLLIIQYVDQKLVKEPKGLA